MTNKVWISKKQRKLMRERQKKKKRYALLHSQNQHDNGHHVTASDEGRALDTLESSQTTVSKQTTVATLKNGTSGQVNVVSTSSSTSDELSSKPNRIVVPANLTAKEAKKFRKDARRRARLEGRDESKLVFITTSDETKKLKSKRSNPDDPDNDNDRPQKKRKREFPRINQLLETAKEEQDKLEKEKARKEEEANLPAAYKARYVALDCEMVGIGSEGRKSALARVSLTDWDGNILLDTFVQVPSRVTDFRTHVSGVKAKHIKQGAAMEVAKCRETVAALVKGKILVGHALKNDFQALMMQHPKDDIRDTAKYRPFQRYGNLKWRPRKLRDLVKENLDLTIQEEGQAHDSVDDARATMELFKCVRKEWEEELQEKKLKQQQKKRRR